MNIYGQLIVFITSLENGKDSSTTTVYAVSKYYDGSRDNTYDILNK